MTDEEKNVEEEPEAEEAETESTEDAVAEPAKEAITGDEDTDAEDKPAEIEQVVMEKGLSGAEKAKDYLAKLERSDHPEFGPGDTIKVHYKIIEGTKERIQVYEGVVIAIKHSGLDKTFTVRKVSWSVGVERTFFYHSQKIGKITRTRQGRVRRAKIYYLRKRVGKAAKIKELRKSKAKAK